MNRKQQGPYHHPTAQFNIEKQKMIPPGTKPGGSFRNIFFFMT